MKFIHAELYKEDLSSGIGKTHNVNIEIIHLIKERTENNN